MMHIQMKLDSTWHDISRLYVARTLSIQKVAMNSERRSSVSSCSFTIRFDQRLYDAVMSEDSRIPVKISDEAEPVFLGYMDPVLSAKWNDRYNPDDIKIECVDFSILLDDPIRQSASYPSDVDGTPYWIYNPDDVESSLLFRVLEQAGLAKSISRDAPAILQRIRHVAWNSGEATCREIIDSLLSDYGWVLIVSGEHISWVRTACISLGNEEDIWPADICGEISKDKEYIVHDGVRISWPKVKIMDDALLWRGNLPIGDTANPRPGEAIAAGDYWPEDSDIIETWQKFGVDYLDTEWLEGKTRIKNDEITLISSSNHVLRDDHDEEVVVDPIFENQPVVFEALRARLRYRNTASEARRLYFSQINGKALVKTHQIETMAPEQCANPEPHDTSYVFDQESAVRLARIRLMWQRNGAFILTFSSRRSFDVGGYYRLHQHPIFDGFIQITSAMVLDGSPLVTYSARSTAPFSDVKTISTGSLGSGSSAPGQDGASYRHAYTRSFSSPLRPVGASPDGWQLDVIPEGSEPAWMSMAKFSSTGQIVVDWTDPVRVDGVPAPETRYIYKRAYNKPEIPVGDSPDGWTFDRIPDGYEPVWQSIGQFGETGNLVESWTEPVRVSGQDLGGYRGMRDALPSNPQDGDYILYTGPSAGDLLQYHVYKYVAIDGQWVETTESDKVMALQKDALDISRSTGEVIYAASIFVDLLVARKLMVGGGDKYSGLVFRVLDDDGSVEHKPVIEISAEGKRLFWVDFDTGRLYGNFARVVQYLPYTFNDSIDGSHPAKFDFFLPEGEVVWVRLSVKSQPYRNYAKVTTAALDGVKTTKAGGGFSGTFLNGNTGSANGSGPGPHSHSVNLPIPSDSHSHEISVSHSHSLELGITESGQASGMSASISDDGGASYGQEIDIGSGVNNKLIQITSYGWKQIRISSSGLGRIQVQVIAKMRIDTDDDYVGW